MGKSDTPDSKVETSVSGGLGHLSALSIRATRLARMTIRFSIAIGPWRIAVDANRPLDLQ